MNLRTGELVLGRYRLQSLLGAGSSAQVWLALDERLRRPVALKLLHGHLLPDQASRERFVAEARAVAGLNHPGIAGIYDVIADESMAAIVFEYVAGESLDTRLRRGNRPSPEEAARIAAEVAEALAAAHRAGIVHRDVKPANVLLSHPRGEVRLVDFGIARILEAEEARITRPGEIVGTLIAMAPEQLAGAPVGPAADLYALGALLYEMLAGRPPFDARSAMALAESQRRPPEPLPAAPAPLAWLTFDLLRFAPAERPGSAVEVAAFLREWLHDRQAARSGATLPGDDARTTVAAAPPAADGRAFLRSRAQQTPGQRRPVELAASGWPRDSGRRSRPPIAGVAVLVAALLAIPALAIAGQGLLFRSPPPTDSPQAAAESAPAVAAGSSASPSVSPSESPSIAPTEPTDSPSPSDSLPPSESPSVPPSVPPALPTTLSIVDPPDQTISFDRIIVVQGLGPPGAIVTRDIPFGPDAHTVVDELGNWQMQVILDPGQNVLRFRLGDDRRTEQVVEVQYAP